MSKFNVGDKVRCVKGKHGSYTGQVYPASIESDLEGVYVAELPNQYLSDRRFVLSAEHPNPPHIHAECIKAWADGAVIEARVGGHPEWNAVDSPTWSANRKYRIKPTRSPAEIEKDQIVAEMGKLKERLNKLGV